MSASPTALQVAIVDYGFGNLFSVQQACNHAGLQATITSSVQDISQAAAVILPGVGAFGDAMQSLERLDLVSPLRDVASSEKPLIGICLGMQLLMSESEEFGTHAGLGIIPGTVVRFDSPQEPRGSAGDSNSRPLKVPQVGWNRIFKPEQQSVAEGRDGPDSDRWAESPLRGVEHGEYMYFVHSFYAKLEGSGHELSTTRYGDVEFCSSLMFRNIFASQFHPERSGPQGLFIFQNIARFLADRTGIGSTLHA